MLFKAVLLLAAVAVASAQTRVNFRPCGAGIPTPEWFESTLCEPNLCTLTRGQVFTGRAALTTVRSFQTLAITLRATIFGIDAGLTIPPGYDNACNFLEAGGSCPTTVGQQYVWGIQIPVGNTLPALNNIIVQLSAGDAQGVAACAEVDFRLL